jgi:dihydrofolate reductase
LKASSGGAVVTFGGVQTVRSLVATNLVDEYWLKVNPAIVGRGGSMFSDVVERRALTLCSARSFPSGAVALIYNDGVAALDVPAPELARAVVLG